MKAVKKNRRRSARSPLHAGLGPGAPGAACVARMAAGSRRCRWDAIVSPDAVSLSEAITIAGPRGPGWRADYRRRCLFPCSGRAGRIAVVLLEQDGAADPGDGGIDGKDANDFRPALDLALDAVERLCDRHEDDQRGCSASTWRPRTRSSSDTARDEAGRRSDLASDGIARWSRIP